MADDDGVAVDEHFFHDQAHDALPLDDVEGIGGHADPRQKRRECLRESQIRRSFPRLIGN